MKCENVDALTALVAILYDANSVDT